MTLLKEYCNLTTVDLAIAIKEIQFFQENGVWSDSAYLNRKMTNFVKDQTGLSFIEAMALNEVLLNKVIADAVLDMLGPE